MKLLEQVQSDLKKAVLQHQSDLLLQVLRRRADELTFGDIRALLADPLGRGLTDVRVVTLFADAATSPPAGRGKELGEKAPRQPQPRGAAKKASKSVSHQRAPSSKLSTENQITAVLAVLQAAKAPLSSSQIATKVKVHRRTARTILQKLSEAKRVVVSGSSRFTRYALAPSRSGAQADDGASPARRKTTASGGKPSRSTAKSTGSDADYDAAVLATLRASDWLSSSELQATVGGTIEKVRGSLQRLISAKQAARAGEHKYTRYAIWGRKLPSPGTGAPQKAVPREEPASPGRRSKKTAAKQTAPRETQPPSVVESVSAALLAAQQPLSTSELAERVKAHPVSIRRVLLGLIEAGRVVTEGPATRLRYQLATSAADSASPPASNSTGA